MSSGLCLLPSLAPPSHKWTLPWPIFTAFSYPGVCRGRGGSRAALAAWTLLAREPHLVVASPPRWRTCARGLVQGTCTLACLIAPAALVTGSGQQDSQGLIPGGSLPTWPLSLLWHLPPASFFFFFLIKPDSNLEYLFF